MNKILCLNTRRLTLSLLVLLSLNIISCSKEPLPAGNSGGGATPPTPPTVTDPDTYFIDEYLTFNGLGGYWHQQFTVGGTTTFILRCASTYTADFAVFAPSQLNNFQNNQSFTGYLIFDNQFGTGTVTLSAGTYQRPSKPSLVF